MNANAFLGPANATGNHHGRAHAATADNSGSEQCASSVPQPTNPQPQAQPGAQPHPQRFISGEASSSASGSSNNRIIVDIRGANADTDAWNVSIKRKAPPDADRCACIFLGPLQLPIAPCGRVVKAGAPRLLAYPYRCMTLPVPRQVQQGREWCSKYLYDD